MLNHASKEETCIICGHQKAEGIHICNQLICDDCQKKIIETDVTDWKYKFFMNKLAKLQVKQEKVIFHAGSGGEASKR
ncbi:sigma factor G inhibitor Gin [Sporolactobacillus kofuensis]|uniref:Sigma factor G inhibitor Gin n=1 Tax=Sporolactobacillus kofuensis TaxID=269672 RepID=A0ABW1WFU6_9BACL|nr:sigma factor G inhibitor Gin [Sporolactobacillus kofuensis]MCO7176901.1 sigma factor G inhibitor Gin [Sporolactobacillus kofuensis]